MQTYRIALLTLLSTLLLYACNKSDDDNPPAPTTYTLNNLNGERMFKGYAITTQLDSSSIDSVAVKNYLITMTLVNDSTLNIINLSSPGIDLTKTTKTFQFRYETSRPTHWPYYESKSADSAVFRGLHYNIDNNKCYYYEYVKVPPATSTPGYVFQVILEEI